MDEREIAQLAGEEAAGDIRGTVAASWTGSDRQHRPRPLHRHQLCLCDDMLRKVDLMGMANSLEIRNPYLDSSRGTGRPHAGEWKLKGRNETHPEIRFQGFLPLKVLRGGSMGSASLWGNGFVRP